MTRRRAAVGMLIVIALALGGADVATAKKVKTTAGITIDQAVTYPGGTLSVDWKARSKNKRCLRAISDGNVKFYFDVPIAWDREEYPHTDYQDVAKLGTAHFRFTAPGSSTVSTYTGGGDAGPPVYAGSYSWGLWWQHFSIANTHQPGPDWLIGLRSGYVLRRQYKVKYGKRPFRHVIVCEVHYGVGPFPEVDDSGW